MSIPFPFTPVSFSAITHLECLDIGGMAQACYMQLCRHHSGGETIISSERLAKKLGCSVRHVYDCVRQLVMAGLVAVEERPGKASRYRILAWFPGEVVEPTPAPPADDLEASRKPPEDLPPSGGDPIRGSEGSDPESQPVLKRLEKPSPNKSWRVRVIERVEGFLKKRPDHVPVNCPSSTEQEPAMYRSCTEQDPEPVNSEPVNSEPIDPPGALAAAAVAPRQAPAREEQPEGADRPETLRLDPLAAIRRVWAYIGNRTFQHRQLSGFTQTAEQLELSEFGQFTFREEDWLDYRASNASIT